MFNDLFLHSGIVPTQKLIWLTCLAFKRAHVKFKKGNKGFITQ